jgi:hypothetical protein
MRAVTVVVALEIEQLLLQIGGRPEKGAVQAFAPYGADQPFNEWVAGIGEPGDRRQQMENEDSEIVQRWILARSRSAQQILVTFGIRHAQVAVAARSRFRQRKCFCLLMKLEAPPGFEPGVEVLQISSGSVSC